MSGLTNRPTLDSIRMLPIGEVAALPAQHLALLQEDAAAALEASKKAKDWIDGAIALRFADHVQALRREARKDTGTVRFEQDGVTVVADLPKRVDWDQALIAGVVERMRDRVFDIDRTKVRIQLLGVSHQAKRWQLGLEGEGGNRFTGRSADQAGECLSAEGNVGAEHSPTYPIENKGSGECGEGGECFPTLTRARAHAPVREDQEKHSPPSPHSPTPAISKAYAGEGAGEGSKRHSPILDPPAWLDGVP